MDRSIDPRIALAAEFPGYDISELDILIDCEGLDSEYDPVPMRVLFETPSGFAIFGIDSGYLYDIGSDYTGIETIWVNCVDKESADMFFWLKGFLELDRSSAILPDHIDTRLADLIEKLCDRGEKLIVGEIAYKSAIEKHMGIDCICDEATEELMWGLQNLMHVLVPEEKSEFNNLDRKYHSKKLLGYLHQNVPDFYIKPEMINGQIASFASFMRRCDVACNEHAESLHSVHKLLDSSGLKTDHWDIVTHATAVMALIGESVVMPDEMFTADEREKIHQHMGKHNDYDKASKANMRKIYMKVVRLNQARFANLDALMAVLHKVEAASKGTQDSGGMLAELPQVFCLKEDEADGQRKKLKVNDDEDGVI